MDSFLGSSDSGVPKDLGKTPKEQFGDLITDHSRFPSGEEKSDISQKFPPEVDLLGDSFTMPSTHTAPDNKVPEKEKENFDDFFMGVEEKINAEPAASSINNLIDVGEPNMFEPKKKINNEPEKSLFTDSAPFGSGPDELVQVKDEIESDYMNPYADIRQPPVQSQKADEPSAASSASTKDDLFDDFVSHSKNDQFDEPLFADSSSSAAASSIPPPVVTPAPPVVIPAPVPIISEPVEEPKTKAPVEPPQEKPKAPPIVPSSSGASASNDQCIQAEKIFKQFGLVESLIYWRDVKKSGIVFGAGLTILIAMSLFSLISVFSYVSLLALFGTVSFRIYKNVLQAVQKTSEGHPFKEYLDTDLTLSQEKVQQLSTVAVAHVNALLTELRRLFLVEDLVDSIKFGVVLYCLTYVGAIFNGMTCVIIAFVALFTLPKVYENNKQSIDAYLELVRSKILEVSEKIKAAVPIGKKAETEKDK
ncbi:reticulon-3 isoform X2 [Armigeres subalbatus]|uniref:reticulon-3 isoform X2 n=1 Tax=Armigeres subalbatus TaxID=124917 RepID=UPI002ED386AE